VAQEIFEKDMTHRTLNSSEAVARGCSLAAAMILPHFHVANFEIQECNSFPVDVSWSISEGQMKTKTLFPLQNNFPSIKSMTFDKRTEPMDVAVAYNQPDQIVKGIPTLLARYKIEVPKPEHEKFGLKLRVKLDQNQIPGLDTAELVEEYKEEKQIAVKADAPPAAKKEGEEDAKEEKKPEQTFETKLVDKTRTTNINFKWEKHGYTASQLDELYKQEEEMFK
jgi:heat shock protein 4